MFTALLSLPVDTLSITEVMATIKQVTAQRAMLDSIEARLASRANQLAADGKGIPAAEILTRSAGISSREARRIDRRSQTLDSTPELAIALSEGSVSAEHIDALGIAAGRLKAELRAELLSHDSTLARVGTETSPERFARLCRDLADQISADHGEDRSGRQRRRTSLHRWIDHRTGMYRANLALDPETGHRVWSALDAQIAADLAASEDPPNVHAGDGKPTPQAETSDRDQLAAFALASLVSGGNQAERPGKTEMTVIVDIDILRGDLAKAGICEFADGTNLSAATARRLACDAHILPAVLNGKSIPLDLGRSRRLASAGQRAALAAVYRTCAFDTCDIDFSRCEIHHIDEWLTDRGPTDLPKLVPICSRHHHHVHEGGWHLDLAPDRTLTIKEPSGALFARCKPDRRPPDGGPPGENALAPASQSFPTAA